METKGNIHLELVELELLRTGEGGEAEAAHVAACAKCRDEACQQERLAAILTEKLSFSAPVIDFATDKRIRARIRTRAESIRKAKAVWFLLGGFGKAAAVAVFVFALYGYLTCMFDAGGRSQEHADASLALRAAMLGKQAGEVYRAKCACMHETASQVGRAAVESMLENLIPDRKAEYNNAVPGE